MTYTPTEQANIDALRRLIAFERESDWDAWRRFGGEGARTKERRPK